MISMSVCSAVLMCTLKLFSREFNSLGQKLPELVKLQAMQKLTISLGEIKTDTKDTL